MANLYLPKKAIKEMEEDKRIRVLNPFSIEVRREGVRQWVGDLLASLRRKFAGRLSYKAGEPAGLPEMQEAAVMELARKLLGEDWDCEMPT